MENKTTSELLDLAFKIEKAGEKTKDGNFDWDKFGEVCNELFTRYPFSEILGEKEGQNDFTLEERIENLEETIKKIKRHKHDEKNGDVMARL